jgi:hypothetical protein
MKIIEALELFEKVLAVDKCNLEALNGKGACLRHLGKRKGN